MTKFPIFSAFGADIPQQTPNLVISITLPQACPKKKVGTVRETQQNTSKKERPN
jgi:hypothetical protein